MSIWRSKIENQFLLRYLNLKPLLYTRNPKSNFRFYLETLLWKCQWDVEISELTFVFLGYKFQSLLSISVLSSFLVHWNNVISSSMFTFYIDYQYAEWSVTSQKLFFRSVSLQVIYRYSFKSFLSDGNEMMIELYYNLLGV